MLTPRQLVEALPLNMSSAQNGKFVYFHRLQGDNIRLLSLLPGTFEDDIRLELWETPLPKNHETTEAQVAYKLEDIRETLPPGWLVEVNLEGALFYARNKPEDEIAETTYTHPVPTFRLDDFVSAPAEQPLKREIPPFEALSYVWGTNTDGGLAHVTERAVTECTALSSSGTLCIGKNLAEALRHLRQTDSARTLWIDAVCIDQSSTEERSDQVAKMGSIYKSATRVVVWLGPSPGPDGDWRIISRFTSNGGDVEVSKDGILYPHPNNTRWMQGFMANRMIRMDATERVGLESFVFCEWFSRVWTLQEIQLAPEALFYWGYETITWKHLRRALLLLDWGVAVTDSVASRLDLICRSAVHLSDFTFRDMIETIRARQCADPRDKLYGIKGLMHPRIAEHITVDYAKPWQEVYRDAFLAHAGLTRSFSLWHGCSAATNLADFASWVPDWSTSLGSDTYFIGNDARASHFTIGHFTYEPPNRLTVAAVHVGTVVEGSVEEVRNERDLRRITEQTLSFGDRLRALPEVLCLGSSRTEFGAHVEAMRRFLQVSAMDDLHPNERALLRALLRSQQDRALAALTMSPGNLLASVRGDMTAIQGGK